MKTNSNKILKLIERNVSFRVYTKSFIDDLIERNSYLENLLDKSTEVLKGISTGESVEITQIFDQDYRSDIEIALIDLQDKMIQESENESNRSWVSEGIARFVELLKVNSDSSLDILCDSILESLVQYLNATQGHLYLIDKTTENGPDFMILKSAYAYDRKKFLQKAIAPGEGLIGQCWLDKDQIYLTEIPPNYTKIHTGTGQTNPTCILIMPLLLNNNILGIVELATFAEMRKFEVDFIRKISENIAATLTSAKAANETTKLLENTSQFALKLQSQEDGMKQNLEEMQVIQEQLVNQELDIVEAMEKEFYEKEQILKLEIERLTKLLTK